MWYAFHFNSLSKLFKICPYQSLLLSLTSNVGTAGLTDVSLIKGIVYMMTNILSRGSLTRPTNIFCNVCESLNYFMKWKKNRCVKTEILSSLVIWYLLFLSFHLELLFPGLCDMKFFYYLCERMHYCIAQGVYDYSNWLPKAPYSCPKQKQNVFLLPIYTVQLITVFLGNWKDCIWW